MQQKEMLGATEAQTEITSFGPAKLIIDRSSCSDAPQGPVVGTHSKGGTGAGGCCNDGDCVGRGAAEGCGTALLGSAVVRGGTQ